MKRTAAIALSALLFLACERIHTRQEAYPDGSPKSSEGFVDRHGARLRQGLRTTCYPGGQRASVEAYADGYLQGYVLRWHPNGRLRSVEHFADGERDGQAQYWDEGGTPIGCYDAKAGDCLARMPGAGDPDRLAAHP